MHILVTNDDGPPSATASPYILPFVQLLERQGHTVSVIVPDVQRSWIGKAHIVGQDIHSTLYYPPSTAPSAHDDSVSIPPPSSEAPQRQPWILLNSTPATCVQIGLSHFFADRPPIDLVISGPNFGRNTTAVFALSSGTLGAALEAAVCGHRAIAISFAFFDRNNDPVVVAEACEQGVKVCEWLAANATWGSARLYSVNVPVLKGVGAKRTVWTRMLQNQWRKGACFQEIEPRVDEGAAHPNVEEAKLRTGGGNAPSAGEAEDGKAEAAAASSSTSPGHAGGEVAGRRFFKWAPRFVDVFDSVEKAGPGSDGWTVKAGETSVTAIHANFLHAEGFEGEIDLGSAKGGNANM